MAVTFANSTVSNSLTTITGYGGTISLAGIAIANLNVNSQALGVNGTTGPDNFTYTPTTSTGGTVNLAGAYPTLNFTNSGTFTLDAKGGGDNVTVNGTTGNDTINQTISGSNIAVQVNALLAANIVTADFQALTMVGLTGNDTFNIAPSATIPISINGGDPVGIDPPLLPPFGDQLNISAGGGAVSFSQGPQADQGSFIIGANQPVSFVQIERNQVSSPGPVTISGTSGDDTFTITAIDASNQAQFGADGCRRHTRLRRSIQRWPDAHLHQLGFTAGEHVGGE